MFKKEIFMRFILFVLFASQHIQAQIPMTEMFDKVQLSGPLDPKEPKAGSRVFGGPSVNSNYGGNLNSLKHFGLYAPNARLSYDIGLPDSFCPSGPYQLDDYKWLLCCQNRAYTIDYDPSTVACCGDQLYLKKEAICCGGAVIFEKDGSENIGCCDDMPYNREELICCNNKLEKIEESAYDGKIACCGLPKARYYNGSKYATLRTDQYSIESKVCCAGHLSSLSSISPEPDSHIYAGCCHESAFNIKTHMCCGINIVPIEDRLQPKCCRAKVFDASEELCCNGVVIKLEDGEKYHKCCGFDKYDPSSQKCCSGKIIDDVEGGEKNYDIKCCSISSYDSSKESCCNGLIINEPSNYGKTCCGFKLYNSHKETCCNQEYIVPRGTQCNYY